MVKKIWKDFIYNFRQNLSEGWSTDGYMMYLVIMNMEIIEGLAQLSLEKVILGLSGIWIIMVSNGCPNRIEKTMYLCPVSRKGRERYLHTSYLLAVLISFFPSLLLCVAGSFFQMQSPFLYLEGYLSMAVLLNMRVSEYIRNCYKKVYGIKYMILYGGAYFCNAMAFGGMFSLENSPDIRLVWVFLVAGMLCLIPALYLFWTRISVLAGDYEMTYLGAGKEKV